MGSRMINKQLALFTVEAPEPSPGFALWRDRIVDTLPATRTVAALSDADALFIDPAVPPGTKP